MSASSTHSDCDSAGSMAASGRYDACACNGVAPSQAAYAVLEALERAGLEAWFVGGWVRDALLGTSSHDVDMCCSGTWQQNAQALKSAGIKVIESGIKFSGITAVIGSEHIEVTSYRLDGFYTDGRHPDQVSNAACIEDDLARRDFTVNALAWHPTRGLLDTYNGVQDLESRLIRAVGKASKRFEEDALRMLRAVRFACRLNFSIEDTTAAALASCAHLLDNIAQERIGIELNGILATGRAGEALLRYPEVMCAAIPELQASVGFDQHSMYHCFDVYEHTAHVLSGMSELMLDSRSIDELALVKTSVDTAKLWAALLHDVAKPECFCLDNEDRGHFPGHPERGAQVAQAVMRRLSCTSEIIRNTCLLIRYHDTPLHADRSELLHMMHKLCAKGADAPQVMNALLDLKAADALAKAPACHAYVETIESMRKTVQQLIDNGEAYSTHMLALDGHDLLNAGVEPGPRIGDLLYQALEAVMAGTVLNKREALLLYLNVE